MYQCKCIPPALWQAVAADHASKVRRPVVKRIQVPQLESYVNPIQQPTSLFPLRKCAGEVIYKTKFGTLV
jgi:hypothetical protein